MAAFDYLKPAGLFPRKSEAELFPATGLCRPPAGYGQFAHASFAIRFAVEELPVELRPDACLQVNDELFDRDGIRRLYDSEDYPLSRRVMPDGRARQSEIHFIT
jgi:hypothetical protein